MENNNVNNNIEENNNSNNNYNNNYNNLDQNQAQSQSQIQSQIQSQNQPQNQPQDQPQSQSPNSISISNAISDSIPNFISDSISDSISESEIANIISPIISKEKEKWHKAGYEEGYEEGYNDGYEAGYEEKCEKARQKGFDEGYEEGYQNGYDDGHREGRSEGYDEGYEAGLAEGDQAQYDEGYQKGYSEGFRQGAIFNADSIDKYTLEKIKKVLIKKGLLKIDGSSDSKLQLFIQIVHEFLSSNPPFQMRALLEKDVLIGVLNFINKFLSFYEKEKSPSSNWLIEKNRKIYELIEFRYSNDYRILSAFSQFTDYLIENINTLGEIMPYGYNCPKIFYSISGATYHYIKHVIGEYKSDRKDTYDQPAIIRHLDYKQVVKSIFKEDSEYISVKSKLFNYISNNDLDLVFLGAGGVNSNLLYTFFTTSSYYYSNYPHGVPKRAWALGAHIYDYDEYDITNLFRIIPPVVPWHKSQVIREVLLSEFNDFIYCDSPNSDTFDEDEGDNYNPFRNEFVIVTGAVQNKFDANSINMLQDVYGARKRIYIGLVNSIERQDIYSNIYSTGGNLIEVTFQDNKFFVTLNPKNTVSSSLVQETYGVTNNILFMLASYDVAKAVEQMVAKILESDEMLPEETVVIDAGEQSVFGKVLDGFIKLKQFKI